MTRVVAVLVLMSALMASWGCQEKVNYLKARSALNKGVTAFTAGNYIIAGQHFEQAAELDSELSAARVYLAYSTMMQYQPGVQFADNLAIAEKALAGFDDVLKDDPQNETALKSKASLYFQMKEMDQSKEWHMKVLDAVPDSKESFYTIGVICWTQSFTPRLQLRADLNMQQEDPGPLRDRQKREELAAEVIPLIDEGLDAMGKAIELDADYSDAMAYINLLYRERADFADSRQGYDEYLALADEWVEKTLETQRRVAEESTIETFTREE